MKKEQILKEIKSLLKFNTEVEKQFIEAVSGENTIKTDGEAFVEGSVVYIETDEGDILATQGEHTLEDGTIIVLDEAGVILEVTEAVPTEEIAPVVEEMEQEVVEEEVVAEVTEETTNTDEQTNSINSRIEEIENLIKELVTKNDETSKFSKEMAVILEKFITEMPVDLEFKNVKTDSDKINTAKKTGLSDRLESIKNMRNRQS